MDIHNKSSSEELLCCRACLSTHCRLFSIHEYKLAAAFSRISGTLVLKDKLPQYLCSYCCTLLIKYTSFGAMCLETQKRLMQELIKGQLNTDCIRRIDRPSKFNLVLTGTDVINCVETLPIAVKKEPIEVIDTDESAIDTAVKCEDNIHKDDVNSGAPNITESHIDANDEDSEIHKAKAMSEHEKVIIKNNNEPELFFNKVNTIKTYKRNITSTANKKMDIAIQGHSDRVNKNDGEKIDLIAANVDKAEINISPDICYANINDDGLDELDIDDINDDGLDELDIDDINDDGIDELDIDDINEVEAHTTIVSVNVIINKAKKKTKTRKRKRTTTKKNIDVDITMSPGKRRREEGIVKNDLKFKTINTYKRNPVSKTIKTYQRNITHTVQKKKEIENEGYSDRVNDNDKDGANIDLDAAHADKAKINISYTNPDLCRDESDIDDINEAEAHMHVVNVEGILRQNKRNRKVGTTANKSMDLDIARILVTKQLRRQGGNINPENDYLPMFDLAKFESDYAVQIVTLSKQEQLEEIAARKQSARYREAQVNCEECGKGFDDEATYNDHHRRRHHPSSGEHVCEICSARFKTRPHRRRHEETHKFKFSCSKCGLVTRARFAAKTHYGVHEGWKFVCKHCGKGFSKSSACLYHVRLTHPAQNVACGTCGETFVGNKGLGIHKAFMHPECGFKCTACSAGFVSSDALDRHTDTGDHSGRPCEQCGESCASEEALQAHVGERHPKESHRCEQCGGEFSSAGAFKTHVRRSHLNQRYQRRRVARGRQPGQCEQCGYVAPSLALLRYHQNGHLAVKPFPCTLCPKTFVTNSAMISHRRMHTGEKPHKCSLCELAFKHKANLNRHHNVVHLGVHANAKCPICARVFTTNCSLRLHLSTVHNGMPWSKRERKRKDINKQNKQSIS